MARGVLTARLEPRQTRKIAPYDAKIGKDDIPYPDGVAAFLRGSWSVTAAAWLLTLTLLSPDNLTQLLPPPSTTTISNGARFGPFSKRSDYVPTSWLSFSNTVGIRTPQTIPIAASAAIGAE